MLREAVKWDYELRNGVQLETVVDRALTIATSPPEGPVYLSLPREVLAAKLPGFAYDSPARRVAASPPAADAAAIEAAARLLAAAKNPLIVTADAGRDRAAVPALAAFAERFAIPVVEHRQRHLNLPADHPCHLGYNPGGAARRGRRDPRRRMRRAVDPEPQEAAPGLPDRPSRRRSAVQPAIRSAALPAMSRSPPRRGWRCRRSAEAMAPLADAAEVAARRRAHRRAARGDAGRLAQARRRGEGHAAAQPGLGQRLPGRGARPGLGDRQRIHAAAGALPVDSGPARFSGRARRRGSAGAPGRRSGSSSPNPSGRSSRCSATARICSRTRSRCITPRRCTGCRCCSSSSTTRCGARCAARPSACTRRARRRAATARRLSISTSLPAFEQVCAAAGGYGERVEDPAELPAALARALHAVNVEKRQALLNVICQGGGGG